MKILITYKSKTEFTKKYAEIIAHETDAILIPFDEITTDRISEFDVIVYGGGLYAGGVNGLKKARELFEKSDSKRFVIFATGGTPNEATTAINEMWEHNLSKEDLEIIPHFYMQAGICYEKMSFGDRTIMTMAASMLAKKKDKSDFDQGFAQAIKESYDISDKVYAEPLIKYLLEIKSQSEI